MEDVFVLDWYSIIERHLFRIHCSGYGERKVSALDFQKLGLFNMYKEKMHELMRSLFGMKKKAKRKVPYKVSIGDEVLAQRNDAELGLVYQRGVVKGKNRTGRSYKIDFRMNRNPQSIVGKKIKLMWYDRWIQDYRAELKEEEERPDRKFKQLRIEMVHKKYDNIRRRQRLRPPTEWLRKHKLIVC